MINFIKNLHFFITLAIRLYNLVPMPLFHNIERIKAYRRVFFYINFEHIEGDYLDFGVYEGSSMITAFFANKASSKTDGLVMYKNEVKERSFIGFDSFEMGFKYFNKDDKHENWPEGHLKSSFTKTLNRLNRISKKSFKLVPGFVENTLPEIKKNNYIIDNFEIKKIAVMLIDMDLFSPALAALNFAKDLFGEGSIIIIDNYFNFKSNPSKGEMGAINEFSKINKKNGHVSV